MNSSEKLFLLALESMTSDQLEALIAIGEKKAVPLAELVEEALEDWIAKEFEGLDEGDA